MASESLLTLARYMQGTPAAAQGAAAPVAPAAVAPMDPMDQPTHPATAAVVPQIIEIIMTSVEPDTWVDQGGELGHITFLPVHSSLIVTHTPEVQQKVADLLASIQDRRVVSAQARLVRGDDDAVAAGLKVEQGVISMLAGDVFDSGPVMRRLHLFKAIYAATGLANFKRWWADLRERRRQSTSQFSGGTTPVDPL